MDYSTRTVSIARLLKRLTLLRYKNAGGLAATKKEATTAAVQEAKNNPEIFQETAKASVAFAAENPVSYISPFFTHFHSNLSQRVQELWCNSVTSVYKFIYVVHCQILVHI